MGQIIQAQADARRARMRLARKLGSAPLDNTRLGASPPSRLAVDQSIEKKVPQASGASFAADFLKGQDFKDPAQQAGPRADLGRALLAKKFVGGDLLKGGSKEERRRLRDAQRYTLWMDAAKKG